MSALPPDFPGVKKAFVCYLDSYFGSCVAKKLISIGIEVTGLMKDASGFIPGKVKKAYRRNEIESVRRALLDADYIIYELIDGIDDATAAIRYLECARECAPKRFILMSSILSWYETPLLHDDDGEPETLTEDQYNRRVPHTKYLAWRELEKLCGTIVGDLLSIYVVYSGLYYGNGENVLHAMFKQAWCLGSEGLPIFGSGNQKIPMIHVQDAATVAYKLLTTEEEVTSKYIFAADDGKTSWIENVEGVNRTIGTGKTFYVPFEEFCLHDNIEWFTVDLSVEPATINTLMDEEDWMCKSGFVENIDLVVDQYKKARGVTPLRLVILGAPLSGKSYAARELASALSIPHFTLGDAVAEYRYQETELREELERLRLDRYNEKLHERIEGHRQRIEEERRIAREEAINEAADAPIGPDEDDDDVEEDEEIDVTILISPEEEAEIREMAEDDSIDDRAIAVKNQIEEIKKVLAMRLKPILDSSMVEPPHPKDKKKPPAKKDKKKVEDPVENEKDKDRLSDHALAIILRWKLTRTQCRNHGYILDGFPKTKRQARLLFEDIPLEISEDPDEPDLPLDPEEKLCVENIFPDFVLHCKASDTFLLDRLQRTQFEHIHNTPEDFQRRLEFFKRHFEAPVTVIHYLESARSTTGKSMMIRVFDMDTCPIFPPMPPASRYDINPVDPMIQSMLDWIGKPHNFGPSPQDVHREAEMKRFLNQEKKEEEEAIIRKQQGIESNEVAICKKAREEEVNCINQMKESERIMLEERKAPLKAYLMKSVIPILTKGLIEVCNKRPDDPVDYLAEWLFRHNPEDDSMY
eukprot:Tbor_TRINITY_DN5258_c1_g3::TRINITY_DN5258_c1_g3_i1::g.16662::m.16662/K00939/adk, AK; adenylate kinase